MNRGAWQAAVHRIAEWDTVEATKQQQHMYTCGRFILLYSETNTTL